MLEGFTTATGTCYRYEQLESTQKQAKAESNALNHGDVIMADQQTYGRGKDDREWVSERGNVFFTYLHKTPIEQPALLTFAASLALREAVADDAISLKWPNDVLLAHKKCAGILLEKQGDAVFVGMGVNLSSHPENVLFPATHLKAHHIMLQPTELLGKWCVAMQKWEAEDPATIKEAWWSASCHVDRDITINGTRGQAKGIDVQGGLIVHSDTGEQVFYSGDITELG